MWLTISSFAAILSFADLGMGNGLLSHVAEAHGKADRSAIRTYIASSFAVLTLVAGLIIALFWSAFPLISWPKIFAVHGVLARAESGPAVAVFATCFALSIPIQIVQKVQIGLQGSFVASAWQCVGNLLALLGVVTATHFRFGLPWLVLAFVGSPLLIGVLNSLSFFLVNRRDIAPRIRDVSKTAATHIAHTGGLFLILQIVAAASYSSDPLVIAHVLGPENVAQYAVPAQMFSVIGMLISMGLAPLWPAYGEALSRADHGWVRQTFIHSVEMAAGAATAGAIALALFGPALLRLWVGPAISASPLLLLGLAIWKILEASGNAVAMFLNGARVVRFQVVVGVLSAVAILGLKFILLPLIGVAGSVWATIIGFSLFAGIPLVFRASRIANSAMTSGKS